MLTLFWDALQSRSLFRSCSLAHREGDDYHGPFFLSYCFSIFYFVSCHGGRDAEPSYWHHEGSIIFLARQSVPGLTLQDVCALGLFLYIAMCCGSGFPFCCCIPGIGGILSAWCINIPFGSTLPKGYIQPLSAPCNTPRLKISSPCFFYSRPQAS